MLNGAAKLPKSPSVASTSDLERECLTYVHDCLGRLERPSTIAEFARLVYSTLNTVSAHSSIGTREDMCVFLSKKRLTAAFGYTAFVSAVLHSSGHKRGGLASVQTLDVTWLPAAFQVAPQFPESCNME